MESKGDKSMYSNLTDKKGVREQGEQRGSPRWCPLRTRHRETEKGSFCLGGLSALPVSVVGVG